jgi:glutathione S-transferase
MADAARGLVIRVWLIPFSTNVERVALALAHKGLEAEAVVLEPDDRNEVERLSGQALVPVADFDGEVVSDSMAILRRLEELHPEPPLWPASVSARAETDVFLDWFNRVWKVAPNAIAAEIERPTSDQFVIDAHAAEMEAALLVFESLLDGRPYLLGDSLSAADCVAFPFLRYAAMRDPADDELFHRVLEDYQPLGDAHANLKAWIERVDGHPRALR